MRRFLIASTLLLGCVPLPHHERESPDIFGMVKRAGQPVAGLEVLLATGAVPSAGCTNPSATATTDANGQFRLAAVESFHFFLIAGDKAYGWRLCFERADGTPLASQAGGGGLWIPPEVTVACELDDDAAEASCTTTPHASRLNR